MNETCSTIFFYDANYKTTDDKSDISVENQSHHCTYTYVKILDPSEKLFISNVYLRGSIYWVSVEKRMRKLVAA